MAWNKPKKIERMVMVDLWYYDDLLPNVLQSWTWQTVDEGPDYPRAVAWINAMSDCCTIHHWHIKEFDRPVPNFNPALVMPIDPTPH